MFVILQDQRGRLSYAPQNWIKKGPGGREIIYWPKQNLTVLQNDAHSQPVVEGYGKWLIINEVIKRRNIATKEAAEREIDEMTLLSNTDADENATDIIVRPKVKQTLSKVLIPSYDVNISQSPLNSAVKTKIISSPMTPKTPLSSISVQQQYQKLAQQVTDYSDCSQLLTESSISNLVPNVTNSPSNVFSDTLFFKSDGHLIDQHGNVTVCGDLQTANIYNNAIIDDNNGFGNSAIAGANDDVVVADLFQTIINNQEIFTKKLITMEKGMQEMFAQLQNIGAAISSLSIDSFAQSTQTESIDFQKIHDEDSLIEFEKKIENPNLRKKIFEFFCSTIGKCNNVPLRSAALLLDQKMFTEAFWSMTAWTGGRKINGPKKFAFANHVKTIAFMNEVLRKVCSLQMSDSEFVDFIKSRTRNSSYVRTSNRQPMARVNRKRKCVNANENITTTAVSLPSKE